MGILKTLYPGRWLEKSKFIKTNLKNKIQELILTVKTIFAAMEIFSDILSTYENLQTINDLHSKEHSETDPWHVR